MRASWALAAAAVAGALLLAGCGQKGPLFLPVAQGSAARPAASAPSVAEDRASRSPVPLMPGDIPTPAPTGVVPPGK